MLFEGKPFKNSISEKMRFDANEYIPRVERIGRREEGADYGNE